METRTSICVRCGEKDYRDFFSFIDGKAYCSICTNQANVAAIQQITENWAKENFLQSPKEI